MTPEEQAREVVRSLLAGLSAGDVLAASLEALRRWWRSTSRATDTFQMHGDLGRELSIILAERKKVTVDPQSAKEPFLMDQREPWMKPVVEVVWWLVRSGFAIPLLDGHAGYPSRLRITESGIRLLESTEDHPVLPGFLDRLRQRCPGIPDEVIVHLADARSCLEHDLRRPSIVLLGLGYETAIEAVVEALVTRGVLAAPAVNQKAWKKIELVRAALSQPRFPDIDAKSGVETAWDFADQMRRRRNDGSHSNPHFDFTDGSEMHEYFLSALRHLPQLWSIAVLPD
jgi:hypothetical protein